MIKISCSIRITDSQNKVDKTEKNNYPYKQYDLIKKQAKYEYKITKCNILDH